MNSILTTILQQKKVEIAEAAASKPLSELIKQTSLSKQNLSFVSKLKIHKFPAIIAEIKRASPSKGNFRPDLHPLAAASSYVKAGAACLSILTDEKFFNGNLSFIAEVKEEYPGIPVLRKDFIIHPYQVVQSKVAGADAILLIVAALKQEELRQLLSLALEQKLDVLIEVHNEEELDTAYTVITDFSHSALQIMIGINNRDLNTFTLDLNVSKRLIEYARKNLVKLFSEQFLFIAESGIKTHSDLISLQSVGINGFLVGESLVMQGDLEENLSNLING